MGVAAWLARAERDLGTAREVLESNPDAACNGAYYAMYYAARAALIEVGQTGRAEGKTHAGLIGAFNQFLVKPGHIAAEHGRAYAQVADHRLAADYELAELAGVTAGEVLERAEAFVAAVRRWVATRAD